VAITFITSHRDEPHISVIMPFNFFSYVGPQD
jgi:hypothetical protein